MTIKSKILKHDFNYSPNDMSFVQIRKFVIENTFVRKSKTHCNDTHLKKRSKVTKKKFDSSKINHEYVPFDKSYHQVIVYLNEKEMPNCFFILNYDIINDRYCNAMLYIAGGVSVILTIGCLELINLRDTACIKRQFINIPLKIISSYEDGIQVENLFYNKQPFKTYLDHYFLFIPMFSSCIYKSVKSNNTQLVELTCRYWQNESGTRNKLAFPRWLLHNARENRKYARFMIQDVRNIIYS